MRAEGLSKRKSAAFRLCLREGQKALPLGQAGLQAECRSLREAECSESQPPPTFPLSLFSPYCPLPRFPRCYKLQTTQTSRPNALPWTPSKLPFQESQEAGFIDNTRHTVHLFVFRRGERPETPAPLTISWPSLLENDSWFHQTMDLKLLLGSSQSFSRTFGKFSLCCWSFLEIGTSHLQAFISESQWAMKCQCRLLHGLALPKWY